MLTTPSGCIMESAVPAQSLAVVLSNLKKASEKLGRIEETRILGTLAASLELRARYNDGNADGNTVVDPSELQNTVSEELSDLFPGLTERAEAEENRGVLRALVWGKVLHPLHHLGDFTLFAQKLDFKLTKCGTVVRLSDSFFHAFYHHIHFLLNL